MALMLSNDNSSIVLGNDGDEFGRGSCKQPNLNIGCTGKENFRDCLQNKFDPAV